MFEPTQADRFYQLPLKTLLLVLFVLLGSKATAVNYYVNDLTTEGDVYTLALGNDSQDGLSPATPKLTLAAVYQLAHEGDFIYIDSGQYPESQNQLITENKKKVHFVLAPQKTVLLSKESLSPIQKTNPAEFYIENDQPVDRAVYLQHKRSEGKKS
jgi:hypothetical protein